MKRNTILLAVSAAVLSLGLSGCQFLEARDNLNKGIAAFKGGKYPEAEKFFLKAVELEPNNPNTHLYLATAYVNQYIPGAESEDNKRMAQAAHNQFTEVLKLDAKNEVAVASIASLYFNQKDFKNAIEWNKKLIEINPQNKDAYYTLGVIAWTEWLVPDREARNDMKMKPEDPGPLKDAKVRAELKQKYMPMLDEGIRNMAKALEIDPEYDEAMAYMNLLIRYRADLVDTPEDFRKESEIADNWVQKSLQTKKIKAERAAEAAAKGQIVKN